MFIALALQGLTLHGASRHVFVHEADAGLANDAVEDAVVEQCELATVYLLSPFHNVLVSGCTSVTVVVGAVGGRLTVRKCHKCTIVAACGGITLSSVDESQVRDSTCQTVH
jgi:hypothetical protein